MRNGFCILFLFLSLAGKAQTVSNTPLTQSIQGSVVVPPLLSLEVSNMQASITLGMNDLDNPKFIPGICNVKILANIPWELSVSSSVNNFESVTNSDVLPVNLVSLKASNGNVYYPLSQNGQAIAENENDNVSSNFGIDMKIDPLNNFPGGTYSTVIFFTLTAQ